MPHQDDLVIKTLFEIKEDLGGLSSDVKSVKESMVRNDSNQELVQTQIHKMEAVFGIIPGHIQAVRDMEIRIDGRIGKIEIDVKAMRETEIPQIKEQLVVGKWLASGRNKAFALIGVGLLGAAGSAVAGLVRDNINVTFHQPSAKPATTGQPVVGLPDAVSMSTDLDADP